MTTTPPDVPNVHGGPGSYSEAAMQSMREKVAQLEADARRWRYCEEMCYHESSVSRGTNFVGLMLPRERTLASTSEEFRAAVDAAIAKESKNV